VIDGITGDLYGHIVAGVPETGLAYILPANKTFQEIEEVLGSKPTLKTRRPPHGGTYHAGGQSQGSEAFSITKTRGPLHHGRNWMNPTEQSQTSEVPCASTEMDAQNHGISSLQRFMNGLVGRRQTDEYLPVVLTGGSVRTTWVPSAGVGLGHIPEAGETRLEIDRSQETPVVTPQTP
jgi:hypothetical protein